VTTFFFIFRAYGDLLCFNQLLYPRHYVHLLLFKLIQQHEKPFECHKAGDNTRTNGSIYSHSRPLCYRYIARLPVGTFLLSPDGKSPDSVVSIWTLFRRELFEKLFLRNKEVERRFDE
jgi:hypothetical protein